MADYLKHTRTVVTREYTLRTPTNAVEMDKAMHNAKQDFAADNPDSMFYDDTLRVTADEERIIISYTVRDTRAGN